MSLIWFSPRLFRVLFFIGLMWELIIWKLWHLRNLSASVKALSDAVLSPCVMRKRSSSNGMTILLSCLLFVTLSSAEGQTPNSRRRNSGEVDQIALKKWARFAAANQQTKADAEWRRVLQSVSGASDIYDVMQSAIDEYRFASGGIVKPEQRDELAHHLADLTAREAGAGDLLAASAFSIAADEDEKANKFDMALRLRREIVSIRQKHLGADSDLTLQAKDRLARLLIEMGKVDEAKGIVSQNESAYKKQRNRAGLERVSILNSRINLALGKRSQQPTGYEVYIDNEAVQKAMRSKDFDAWLAAYKRGDMKSAEQLWIKLVTPLKHCEQIMDLLTRARESADLNAPNWVAPDEKFGSLLMHLHNSTIKALGAEHPAVAGSCRQLADFYSFRGRHKQSADWWQKKVDILKRNFGMKDHDTIFSMGFLAREQEKAGDYDAAIKTINEAIAMAKFNRSKFLLQQNEQELKRLLFAKQKNAMNRQEKDFSVKNSQANN